METKLKAIDYQSIVQNAHEGIVVAQDGMIKFHNQRMLELTGMSAAEYVSRPFIEHVHPDDRAMVMERHQSRLKGETQVNTTPFRIIDKQGRIKWLQPSGVLIEWEGRPATLGFFTEVTELKQAEKALLSTAAGVAHNFNNVLMATMSNAQAAKNILLREKIECRQLEDLLDNVVQASRYGRDIVRRLSTVVDNSPAESNKVVLDAGQLLSSLPSMTTGFSSAGQSNQHEVRLNLEEGLYVNTSAGELMEVFINLAQNAIEAMPFGGVLEISGRIDHNEVVIEFSDNGIGADQLTLARFFDPFFSTKGGLGHGLGLTVSRSIVMANRGTLRAESQREKGTTMIMRLPLARSAPVFAYQRKPEPPCTPMKILLVEDEGVVAMGIVSSLELIGHHVHHVVTLESALEAMANFRPNLIITDLGLPDIGSMNVCTHLEQYARLIGLEQVPVIVLSGWSERQAKDRGFEVGHHVIYIEKPIGNDRLLKAIEAVIANK